RAVQLDQRPPVAVHEAQVARAVRQRRHERLGREGRMTLFVGSEVITLEASQSAYAPIGVPHAYRVDSETARWLGVAGPAGFDRFVLDASDPAPVAELPPADTPVDLERIG